MSELFNAGQILGREEMKKIMAGSTNCWICSTGGWMCATPGGGGEYDELPEEEGTTCTWGECDQC